MKLFQKLLILILITALMLAGAAACQKRTGSQGIGSANNTGENEEDLPFEYEDDPYEENGKKVGGKYKKYLDLLNKASKLDNFYSECTQYMNAGTAEVKMWLKGNKVKTSTAYENDLTIVHSFDLDKAESIGYNDKNQGFKSELTEDEVRNARAFVLWFLDVPEYFSNPEYVKIADTREEDFNGLKCVYVKAEDFDGQVAIFHISKKYGVVMNIEFYSQEGEKVMYVTRNVFEVGKATDQDFVIPDEVQVF